jgi:predicted small lipoprotein YifL
MRRLLTAIALVLSLTGCGTLGGLFQPVHAPTTIEGETAVQRATRLAHATLDEAYVDLTALDIQIGKNVAERIWTKEQGQRALNESISYRMRVDEAYRLLKLGDLSTAQSQAELIQRLIVTLQRKVAETARESTP